MDNSLRIIVKDYDPVTESVILHDNQNELSDLLVYVDSIKKWKSGESNLSKTRLKIYMRYIKIQGGKITILEQIEKLKEDYSYI